jgi:NTP pyrophosphatase (non-canonical NTP hydrolase)
MEKIFELLLKNDTFLTKITGKNGVNYNLVKSAEESSELATALLQKATKDIRVEDQAIIDEVGDVFIRLVILTKMYGVDNVLSRLKYKLEKFHEYNDSERYQHI